MNSEFTGEDFSAARIESTNRRFIFVNVIVCTSGIPRALAPFPCRIGAQCSNKYESATASLRNGRIENTYLYRFLAIILYKMQTLARSTLGYDFSSQCIAFRLKQKYTWDNSSVFFVVLAHLLVNFRYVPAVYITFVFEWWCLEYVFVIERWKQQSENEVCSTLIFPFFSFRLGLVVTLYFTRIHKTIWHNVTMCFSLSLLVSFKVAFPHESHPRRVADW